MTPDLFLKWSFAVLSVVFLAVFMALLTYACWRQLKD